MHILLTRPAADSHRLAGLLSKRGHSALVAPLLEIVPLRNFPAEAGYEAIFITSTRAFGLFLPCDEADMVIPEWMRACPLYVVGKRTADAARSLGWTAPVHVVADVASLLEKCKRCNFSGKKCLYLAGRMRKPDLESELRRAGCELDICETYDAIAARQLPESANEGLANGTIDAVMHFSRRSAALFVELVRAAHVETQAREIRHFCLSSDVAAALEPLGAKQFAVAAVPDMDGMLRLLDGV